MNVYIKCGISKIPYYCGTWIEGSYHVANSSQGRTCPLNYIVCITIGGKSGRGMRISSYDPDDPMSPNGGTVQQCYNSLDSAIKPPSNSGQRVSTITQNYTEKTMLLSSDDEN